LKKLDWYIVKKFLSTFFFAIIILAVISCVIDLSEKMEDFVEHAAPLGAILNYFKNFIPHISALLFPLFIFIATIFFTSKLAYKSEIIAILASGVSFQRFLRPYAIGAAFLCGLSLFANHWVVPNANKQRLAFEDQYIHGASIMSDRNVHLQLTKNLYVFMQSYDYTTNVGYRFTAETIQGTQLKEKLMAERASYDSVKKVWKLYSVMVRKNDGIKESLEFIPEVTKAFPSFKPADLEEDDAIKEALNTTELNRYIAREQLRGRETLNFFYVEKHRRTAQPFAGFILTMIGVCIASRKIRGGSGLHLALGIVISAAYIMAMQMSTTFSTKAGLNPMVAVWIPNFIFGALAYYLYRRQTT
jgi:lipopolysaccharide export system permease protein